MFDINNSRDRLVLLKSNFERLVQDPLDISLAEKACNDAWHLSDWVYNEMKELNQNLILEAFRVELFLECPEMKILHDLANSFKHKILSRPKVQIKITKRHHGAFSSAFSNAFDISGLEVHFEDGSKIFIEDVLKTSIEYWDKRLNFLTAASLA